MLSLHVSLSTVYFNATLYVYIYFYNIPFAECANDILADHLVRSFLSNVFENLLLPFWKFVSLSWGPHHFIWKELQTIRNREYIMKKQNFFLFE